MRTIDKIALIITATTAAILLMITIGPLVTGKPLSEEKAGIVGNLISSFIAILSMYVGSQMKVGAEPDSEKKADETK